MALHIDCVTQICSTNKHNTSVEHFQHYINISKVFKLNRVAHQYILFKLWLRHKHNTCVTYIVFILDFFHILPKLCLHCIFNQWYNVCTVYSVHSVQVQYIHIGWIQKMKTTILFMVQVQTNFEAKKFPLVSGRRIIIIIRNEFSLQQNYFVIIVIDVGWFHLDQLELKLSRNAFQN